jgi:hypothetical protein
LLAARIEKGSMTSRSWAHPRTGHVHFAWQDIHRIVLNDTTYALSEGQIGTFIHELTHVACYGEPLPVAMASLHARQRWSHFNAYPDVGSSFVLDGARIAIIEAFYAPLYEGLALFAQFDATPGPARTVSTAMRLAMTVLFRQNATRIVASTSNIASRWERLYNEFRDFLAHVRLSRAYVQQKASLFTPESIDAKQMRSDASENPYFTGYLTIKSLWNVAVTHGCREIWLDSDLFLSYLITYFFQDFGLIAIVLRDSASPTEMYSNVSLYLQNRQNELIELLANPIRVSEALHEFEESLLNSRDFSTDDKSFIDHHSGDMPGAWSIPPEAILVDKELHDEGRALMASLLKDIETHFNVDLPEDDERPPSLYYSSQAATQLAYTRGWIRLNEEAAELDCDGKEWCRLYYSAHSEFWRRDVRIKCEYRGLGRVYTYVLSATGAICRTAVADDGFVVAVWSADGSNAETRDSLARHRLWFEIEQRLPLDKYIAEKFLEYGEVGLGDSIEAAVRQIRRLSLVKAMCSYLGDDFATYAQVMQDGFEVVAGDDEDLTFRDFTDLPLDDVFKDGLWSVLGKRRYLLESFALFGLTTAVKLTAASLDDAFSHHALNWRVAAGRLRKQLDKTRFKFLVESEDSTSRDDMAVIALL